MVTEVITWRMAQGVTMMMKVSETAERDLKRLTSREGNQERELKVGSSREAGRRSHAL